MSVEQMPLLNATLNGCTAILLALGYIFIKSGNRIAHRRCMVSAILTSVCFLTSYLIYHALHGSTPYTKEGISRIIYFTILISHTILAVVMLPLIVMAIVHAVRENFEKHKQLVRWAWPIWIYVSVTGVVIYVMLYRL